MRHQCTNLQLAAVCGLFFACGDSESTRSDASIGDAGPADGATVDALAGMMHSYTIAGGGIAEPSALVAEGSVLEMAFSSNKALEWNIHFHAGTTTVIDEGSDVEAAATITADKERRYFILLSNEGDSSAMVDLTLAIDGTGEITF